MFGFIDSLDLNLHNKRDLINLTIYQHDYFERRFIEITYIN